MRQNKDAKPMKVPTSLKDLVEDLNDYPVDFWLFRTRMLLNSFVEFVIKKGKPCYLAIPDRKASHLFYALVPRLIETGFSIGFIRLYEGGLVSPEELPKQIGVLVDSVNSTTELKKIIDFLEPEVEVKKVFCYITTQEAIDKIQEFGIEKENIVTFRVVNPKDYDSEYRRLLPFFLSRIDPMDTGLVFNNYEVEGHLREKDFLPMFTKSVQNALKNTKIRFKKKKRILTSKNVHKYSFDCVDFGQCLENVDVKKTSKIQVLDYEFLSIDLKVQCRKEGIQFRLTVLCSPLMSISDFKKRGKCSIRPHTICYLDEIDFQGDCPEEMEQAVCPQCVDNTMARRIIDLIGKELKKGFRGKGYSLREYRPSF